MSLFDFDILGPRAQIKEDYFLGSKLLKQGEYGFRVTYIYIDPLTEKEKDGSLWVETSPDELPNGKLGTKKQLENYLFDIVEHDRLGVSDIKVLRDTMRIDGAYVG